MSRDSARFRRLLRSASLRTVNGVEVVELRRSLTVDDAATVKSMLLAGWRPTRAYGAAALDAYHKVGESDV